MEKGKQKQVDLLIKQFKKCEVLTCTSPDDHAVRLRHLLVLFNSESGHLGLVGKCEF